MRRLLCSLALASIAGCLQLGAPADSTTGATSGGAAGSSADAGVAPAMGVQCGVDPASGIALCLGITSCPTVLVHPDQFPNCGYRIAGGAIDLECVCNDSLCPMGSAASCADAKALLADQSTQGVCAKLAEGHCAAIGKSEATSNGNSSASCDKNCRAQCAGDPGCMTLCGC